MKKNLRIYLAALALFASGMGYLVWSGLSEGATYHIDVAEALAMPEEKLAAVRVFGTVSPDNLVRAADSLGVAFLLQDQNNPRTVIAVIYKGAVPEGFKPGMELYAEGRCASAESPEGTSGGKILHARELTTKCPSKYKKENRT